MDESFEFETATGGLVVLDPEMFDLLDWEFGYRLGIVMDPQGLSHEALGEEPWPKQWIRAAEPLQELQEQGQFQLILTGEAVFHMRVTDEKHQLRAKARSSVLCGRLRVESERLVVAESWPDPEDSQQFDLPRGEFQVWMHVLDIPADVTRTVGVFGTSDFPYLAIELVRDAAPAEGPNTFPVRLPLPEDEAEPSYGWLCRATVKRNEGDFLLLDLHRNRRETLGQGRLPARPAEGLRPGDQVLVRILQKAQGFWSLELDRRL